MLYGLDWDACCSKPIFVCGIYVRLSTCISATSSQMKDAGWQAGYIRLTCRHEIKINMLWGSHDMVHHGAYITSEVKYSLLMHRIKIKSPANFFYGMNKTFFVGGFIIVLSVLLWWYYNDKKAYRILALLPFKMSATSLSCGLPWSLAGTWASTPWAMSLYLLVKYNAWLILCRP